MEARFGNEVKEARELRGWTQERLRRALLEGYGIDLSPTAMTRLEGGKRPIRLNEVSALAKLLGLDLQQYGSGIPRLSEEEYEEARRELQRIIVEQGRAAERASQLEQEGAEIMRIRKELAQQRARYEWMTGEYEVEREGAAEQGGEVRSAPPLRERAALRRRVRGGGRRASRPPQCQLGDQDVRAPYAGF